MRPSSKNHSPAKRRWLPAVFVCLAVVLVAVLLLARSRSTTSATDNMVGADSEREYQNQLADHRRLEMGWDREIAAMPERRIEETEEFRLQVIDSVRTSSLVESEAAEEMNSRLVEATPEILLARSPLRKSMPKELTGDLVQSPKSVTFGDYLAALPSKTHLYEWVRVDLGSLEIQTRPISKDMSDEELARLVNCPPPLRDMKIAGDLLAELRMRVVCGDAVRRTISVFLIHDKAKGHSFFVNTICAKPDPGGMIILRPESPTLSAEAGAAAFRRQAGAVSRPPKVNQTPSLPKSGFSILTISGAILAGLGLVLGLLRLIPGKQ